MLIRDGFLEGAGFRKWQELGRHVCKGQRGIAIFAPCPFKKTVTNEQGQEEVRQGMFFKVVHVFDVAQNVEGGARYFSWLLHRFAGRTDLALAGYNAGEGSVDQYDGIPPYGETQRYVDRVLSRAARLGGETR